MRTILHDLRLFDGLGDAAIRGKAVAIEGDRIVEIGEAEDMRRRAKPGELVDLDGAFLLPGLIDAHVHVTVPMMSDFRSKEAFVAVERQRERNLRSCLRHGVTTIRDMGAFPAAIRRWKARIEAGLADGPRILTPNTFITSRGGPPERAPVLPLPIALAIGGQFVARVRKPSHVRRAALRNLAKGADFLKTQWARQSMFYQGRLEVPSDECLAELVRVARERGVRTALHQAELEGFRKGLRFGFDSLEHCPLELLEESDADAFAASGASIVPTLRVNRSGFETEASLSWVRGEGKEDFDPVARAQVERSLAACGGDPYPPEDGGVYLDLDLCKRGFEHTIRNVGRIHSAGGRVGAGSDAFGCYLNLSGFLWKELELLAEAGLGKAGALRAATSVNADILGRSDIGAVAAGKLADLVVIDADGSVDYDSLPRLSSLASPSLVVKGGLPYADGRRVEWPSRGGSAAKGGR
jgi:imidazolonepropionase-like amidohydrolase